MAPDNQAGIAISVCLRILPKWLSLWPYLTLSEFVEAVAEPLLRSRAALECQQSHALYL